MKAFVFKPTNEFVGKFEFANFNTIHAAAHTFLATIETLPLGSYIESSGRAWTIVCVSPLRLADGIVSPWKDGRAQNAESEPRIKEQTPVASFSCLRCGCSLRIQLSRTNAGFRCPKCQAEFRVSLAGDSPPVFVVIPDASQFTWKSPSPPSPQKQEIPKQVLAALAVFELRESANFEQVRTAYYELVKSYHPDKVAHLGAELRRVAEVKTKEINSAYQILEKFYAA